MNERIKELAEQAREYATTRHSVSNIVLSINNDKFEQKFAELIVQEMCSIMEQAEDDAYHCFEPSERPTEYIEWLRDWQERFAKHFGVEE